MTQRTDPPPAEPAPAPAAPTGAPADDGLMSKLWKAAGSWFGGDAPADQSAAPAAPAQPAPAPSAAASVVVPSIPPLSSPGNTGHLSVPAPSSEEQSPRVVVVQGRRALPNGIAPSAPPPALPPQSASPPQSPRGPRLPAHDPTPSKPMPPRAVSPSPTILSSSPLPDSTLMRAKQPQQAPPPTPAEAPRDSVSQWESPPPPPVTKPRCDHRMHSSSCRSIEIH